MKRISAALIVLVAVALTVPASAQMPDPRQMSGIPRPDDQLPTGTLTVRVIRGAFTNPVDSQTVEILGGAQPLQGTTDEAGRAEFKGLPAGKRIKAVATVAGERLESQEFEMPAAGGVRLALVGSDPTAPAPAPPSAPPASAGPAQPGSVVLGEESRFVFEMGEDGLNVFYILQLQNSSPNPVQTEKPVVFVLPRDARGAALMEGSSPQAAIDGTQLRIMGPFRPGGTLVQVAYSMPFRGAEMVIEQPLPIPLSHVAVVAQKVGDLQLQSPQMPEQQTMPANGNMYIAGRGPALQAGQALRFNFSGMPHHPTWPRNLALVLAFAILAGGAWSSFRPGGKRVALDVQRKQLEGRRDRLFDELTVLETSHRDGTVDPQRYAERRRELVTALERVYTALDDATMVGQVS